MSWVGLQGTRMHETHTAADQDGVGVGEEEAVKNRTYIYAK